jgi:hypothetical protein
MKPMIVVVSCAIALGLSTSTPAESKDPLGVNPAHYQCYRVSEPEPFTSPPVKLADQFGTSEAKVGRANVLCAPVSKNGARVTDKRTHLVCYEDEGPKLVGKKVTVTNQFGTETLACVTNAPSACSSAELYER